MPDSYIGDAFVDLHYQASAPGPGRPLFIDPYGGAVLAVTGTFTATIALEATLDRQTWFAVEGLNLATGSKSTTIIAPGLFVVAAPGAVLLRARIDTYTSGQITVSGRPVVVAEVLPSAGGGGGGGPATEVQIRDGDAAGEARVLSTAPAGTEAGLVVRNIPSGTQTVSGAVTADTELPPAGALADGAANPTTPTVGAAALVFNGTTWDRVRGDTANGVDVDVTRVQGTITTNLAQIGGTAQSGANVIDTTNSALRVNVVAGGGSGGTSSGFGATFPGTGTAAGYNDGTNMQGARVFDLDTGAGTQYVLGVNLRQSAAGGSVEVGTASSPLRVDPTGTTPQPVSGTVTADTELPTGAALADGAANPTTPTVGAAALVFNGSTWDRARGDVTNGLDVDVTRVQGNVTVVQSNAASLNATVTGTVNAAQSGAWNVTADTELPAAAALADGAANPTTPTAGSATLVFNGTSWDRARGDTANGLDVDVTRVQGNVTVVQATAANLNATVTGTVTANQGGAWTVTDGGAGKTLRRAVVSLTATGTVIAAVAGRRLKVYQYAIQSRNDSMTVRFRDGSAGGNLGLEWLLNAREGVSSGPINPPSFLFGTSAGNSLDAVLSGTGTVWIEVSYWDDDAS